MRKLCSSSIPLVQIPTWVSTRNHPPAIILRIFWITHHERARSIAPDVACSAFGSALAHLQGSCTSGTLNAGLLPGRPDCGIRAAALVWIKA